MKKLLTLLVIGAMFTSCEKEDFQRFEADYEFKMTGRCLQDVNGYYHLSLIPSGQLLRFGLLLAIKTKPHSYL